MPLRFLIKTAITVVTPPVIINSFRLPVTHVTAVEPPLDRRRVASLHYRDCTAVVLRRHGGDGGATAVLVRRHGGHGGAAATPLRISPTRDDIAEVLNMLNVLTVFGGATAINDGINGNHGDHGGATAVYVVQAPQWHRYDRRSSAVMADFTKNRSGTALPV